MNSLIRSILLRTGPAKAACSGASLAASVLVVALLGSTTLLQATSAQQVDARAASDHQQTDSALSGASVGGQSRNIYGQKQLSAHRMMHFGKRPMFAPAPSIFIPAPRPLIESLIYRTDLDQAQLNPLMSYNNLEQQRQQQLEHELQSPEDQIHSVARQSLANQQLVEVVGDLLELNKQQECMRAKQPEIIQEAQQQHHHQRPQTMIKFMKLINDEQQQGAAEDEEDDKQKGQGSKRGDEASFGNGELPQDHSNDDSDAIRIAARSLPSVFRHGIASSMPAKITLSSLLYGGNSKQRQLQQPQQPQRLQRTPVVEVIEPSLSSDPFSNLDSVSKKAESNKMTFMHFG